MEQNELLHCVHNTELLDYCLSKEGAYLDFPFGLDYVTVKVKSSSKNRIFAEIFMHNNELKLTFSTDEMTAQFLRSTYYQIIVSGWHCPPIQAKYKSTVTVNKVSDEILKSLVDMSYDRAILKLK